MADSFSGIPPAAARRIAAFLRAADAAVPRLVEAVWVEGSIALGDFQPQVSDVDLFVVTSRDLTSEERRRIRSAGRPLLEVQWSTWSALPSLPTRHLGAVTAATLHRHGVLVRGPNPADVVPDVDPRTLGEQMRENLESYWRPWLEQVSEGLLQRMACLHPRIIEWGAVGVPRQYVTLQQGQIVSKSAALRYVRERCDARWHRILDEALRLRARASGRNYWSPFERRRDMLAFLGHMIERTREVASG